MYHYHIQPSQRLQLESATWSPDILEDFEEAQVVAHNLESTSEASLDGLNQDTDNSFLVFNPCYVLY